MNRPVSQTLSDLLAEQASQRGELPAVVHGDGTASYRALLDRSRLVGASLRETGVVRHDRVGLLMTNRIEWLECCFGSASVGATVHAVNTWSTERELSQFLARSACSVLILQAAHGKHRYVDSLCALVPELSEHSPGTWRSGRYPRLQSVVVVGDEVPRGAHEYESWVHSVRSVEPATADGPTPDDVAVVLYTSGSTAMPKAVPLQHFGMVSNGFDIGERMQLTDDDRVWLGSPLFWSLGCANALMATLTHGATLLLQEQFNAADAVAFMERESCTAAYLLPTMTRAILAEEPDAARRLATVRTGITIGSPQEVRLAAEALGIEGICNVYGSTETYGNCTVTPSTMPLADRANCQGPPLPGFEIRIVNPSDGQLAKVGEVGEIQVKGYVTPGYLDVDNRDVFTADGFFRTGDIGSLDERGCLKFAARTTEMIKTAGINVSPAEVEQCLVALDGVAQAAVVGVPDVHRGEVVVAYVVPTTGVLLDGNVLLEACRRELASYKVPVRIAVVDSLPTTGTGKLSRKKLKELAAARQGQP